MLTRVSRRERWHEAWRNSKQNGSAAKLLASSVSESESILDLFFKSLFNFNSVACTSDHTSDNGLVKITYFFN